MKKRIHPARYILPQILTWITGRERYLPELEWSEGECYTHDFFRILEQIFWRAYGKNGRGDTLRREAASAYDAATGQTYHAFYTLEAALAHFEGEIRLALKGFRLPKIQVYVPVLQPAGMPFQMPVGVPTGYLFAIARDTHVDGSVGGSSLTSISWSHTCSGSNRILAVFAGTEKSPGVDVSGMTYNSVAMTTCGVNSTEYSNTHRIFGYYLIAPATGSNTVVVSHPSCYSEGGVSLSYTGAKQSGQPDAAVAMSEQSGTSATTTLTTVADNCWAVGCGRMDNGGTRFMSGVLTALDISAGDTAQVYGDSNGALTPAGAKTVGCGSSTSDGPNGVFFSIAPLTSTTYNQDVFATTAVSASMLTPKTIVKSLEATATGSASVAMIKDFVRELSATATATAEVLKGLAMELVATATITADTLAQRAYLVAMNATVAVSATTATAIEKVLSATANVSASIAKTFSVSQLLSATATISATIEAGREKLLEAAVSVSSTIQTAIGKTLTANVSITAKVLAPFWRTKYPAHGDEDDYQIKYPHD